MEQFVTIENRQGEKIDTLIEGNEKAKTTVIFVHGFGTDKNETENLFIDIASALKDKFRVVRFDLSGYGKSEGKQEEASYNKHAEDLKSVFDWVKKKFGRKIYILAMSMGCFVTAIASPRVVKVILLSIPNHNMETVYHRVKQRFFSREGSVFNEKGISLLKRSTGKIQKFGPSFWKIMRSIRPLDLINNLTQKTKLLIIHPLQDEIVGNEFIDEYRQIPKVKYIEMNGNHSFKKKGDREEVIRIIVNYFTQP